ncbi:MAG TPA: hypothetical protein VM582_04135, partial [Candidatus Thermoplasmatota archaeon]|nr:hypothetical protein [Candidatus Thermoplasmatota archaeon]
PARGELGSLVAVGAEGAASRGEVLDVKDRSVVASVQEGSQLLFLATPAAPRSETYQRALVQAAAQGALLSHFVTEFDRSDVRTSQVDAAPGRGPVRTATSASGGVSSTVRTAAGGILAYDLAYETLPARSAADVAAYLDGERIPARVWVENGRTQLLADVPAGEHRVSVSASAHASTESQARAERRGEGGARVYGSFEYHANGKLTGEFLTSVIPDGYATLLSFTALASRTEIFESIRVDGGSQASFHAAGVDEVRLETPKADVSLFDDVHATLLVAAKAPAEVALKPASGIQARALREGVLALQGPAGAAGALVLVGDGSLATGSDGVVHASLAHGSRLVFRASPDQHASEEAVLGALAEGRVAAQLLAGVHHGALTTKATGYAKDAQASIRPAGHGALLLTYVAHADGAPRGLVLDVRGASIAAKSSSDIRVSVDGVEALAVPTPEEALDAAGVPRYHAMTSLDGALRVIVNTAAATGQSASVVVSSTVEAAARANARTDAFGAFRVYHDGTAVGSFVRLKADQAAGAVSGFTMIATERPVFASLAAGRAPFSSTSGDGVSVLKLESRDVRLEFSDTTSGFAKILAHQDTEAAFRLAAGLRAESRGASVVELVDERGEQVGSLILVGGSLAGHLETRGRDEVRAQLSRGGELLFRAHAGIESELSAAQRTMINQAIAAGRVAGQVIVQSQAELSADAVALEQTARAEGDSVVLAARRAFGDITSSVTASYGAVNVVTAATKQKVELTIASATHEGKTIIVSLDPHTIPGMAKGKAIIRFDGQIVGQASSYADILDPSDDGDVAEYFVLAGEAGTQVLVSIPHFSVHTVTLEQRPESPSSVYMYASLFLGLLVVVESALLAHGHRKKNVTNNRRP